jgi:thiosulfate dehydrogenase
MNANCKDHEQIFPLPIYSSNFKICWSDNAGMKSPICVLAACFLAAIFSGCSHFREQANPSPYKMHGPLVSTETTMVTAWFIPKNPSTALSADDSKLAKEIKWGFRLFTNTPQEAPQFAPGKISCANCHLNAGQRERSLPVVGIAGMFPEYNRRSGRLYSLGDRVVDCFLRSENATGASETHLPTTSSPEVLALSAYITWLGGGYRIGENPPWRGQNTIDASKLIPITKLDPQRGEALFKEHCTNCHGDDGQGVAIGDKKAGPLWGPDSWNDGAGAARVYTLAGIIRYSMPYLDPGRLSDEEAQQVAAFLNSRPRPSYPFKDQDYRTEKRPVDAVYYTNNVALGEKPSAAAAAH